MKEAAYSIFWGKTARIEGRGPCPSADTCRLCVLSAGPCCFLAARPPFMLLLRTSPWGPFLAGTGFLGIKPTFLKPQCSSVCSSDKSRRPVREAEVSLGIFEAPSLTDSWHLPCPSSRGHFLLPGWHVDVMAGAGAAALGHEVNW